MEEVFGAMSRRYKGDRHAAGVAVQTYTTLSMLIRSEIESGGKESATFARGYAVAPGRRRLFMGHTDLAGMSGPTLNCSVRGEVHCLCAREVEEKSETSEKRERRRGGERKEGRVSEEKERYEQSEKGRRCRVVVLSPQYGKDEFVLFENELCPPPFTSKQEHGKLAEAAIAFFLSSTPSGSSALPALFAASSTLASPSASLTSTPTSPPATTPAMTSAAASAATTAASEGVEEGQTGSGGCTSTIYFAVTSPSHPSLCLPPSQGFSSSSATSCVLASSLFSTFSARASTSSLMQLDYAEW